MDNITVMLLSGSQSRGIITTHISQFYDQNHTNCMWTCISFWRMPVPIYPQNSALPQILFPLLVLNPHHLFHCTFVKSLQQAYATVQFNNTVSSWSKFQHPQGELCRQTLQIFRLTHCFLTAFMDSRFHLDFSCTSVFFLFFYLIIFNFLISW